MVEYPELIAGIAKKQLKRTQIARMLGISSRTLYDKLSGIRDFSLSEATKIQATYFPEIDLDTLFSRTGQAG